MLTVSKLAEQFGLSRTTLLYYEKVKLLQPAYRTRNGYRWYGDKEIRNLQQILAYRSLGLTVENIRQLLDSSGGNTHDRLLRRQFDNLEREIQSLRKQQRSILTLLNNTDELEMNMISKDRWVEIMSAAGLSEEEMHNWHRQFERMEPEAHHEFLLSLNIAQDEINKIRNRSKA